MDWCTVGTTSTQHLCGVNLTCDAEISVWEIKGRWLLILPQWSLPARFHPRPNKGHDLCRCHKKKYWPYQYTSQCISHRLLSLWRGGGRRRTSITTIPQKVSRYWRERWIQGYRNPAKDVLNIDLKNAEAVTVKIYSSTGNLVRGFATGKIQKNLQLNLSGLTSGTYIENIRTNQEVKSFRFV